MKKLKIRTKTIQFKIWKSMLITMVIILFVNLGVNFFVIRKNREKFYFDQLERAATMKNYYGKDHDEREFKDGKEINTFDLVFDNGSKKISMLDGMKLQYSKDDRMEDINSIVDLIDQGNGIIKGVYDSDDNVYVYYVKWLSESEARVYFIEHNKRENDDEDVIIFIAVAMFLLAISFTMAAWAAKKITKPVKQLEVFAKETAKRNWMVELPESDTEEIESLASSLEYMRDSLRVAEERDRQFIQSTSHDLKTPVMIIKGYAQAILDGMKINEEDSAAEVIKNESEKLERRIMQLLRLNTLGHLLEHKEQHDVVRVDRIISSLVKKCEVVAPTLDIECKLDELEVIGDAEALLIAFENLMENQLRYAESKISISINKDERSVFIVNDGPSFCVEDPMILFDAYKKDVEGKFGLGLAIVSNVIKAHDGSIAAYNLENGVAFKIQF